MSDRDVGTARTTGMLTVAGRYRLLTLIASGGMGRVWLAHDELLDRQVAVKEVLPPEGLPVADRRTAQLRTMREARAAARLEHPGVVRIYDVARTTGRSWIVMEYVESRTLQQRIAASGPLPHQQAARIGLLVLGALQAAHAAGVLHHDVKPANVLLAADGRTLLTDFGLATLDVASGAGATGTEPLLGSPLYVAPERLRDRVSSVQTDLWSLGATLYTAVEGRAPYSRSSVAASMAAALAEDPDPPQHPGPVHPVIAGLMVKDPARRSTAADVSSALQAIAGQARGKSAVPAPRRSTENAVQFRPASAALLVTPDPSRDNEGVKTSVDLTAPDTDGQTPTHPSRPSRRRPNRLVLGAVAVAVFGAGGAAVTLSRADNPQRPQPAGSASTSSTTSASTSSTTNVCAGTAAQPLTEAPSALPSVPDRWVGHQDPTGFTLATPRSWQRSVKAGVVCFGDPDGARTFTVNRVRAPAEGPLQHWQAAEQAALVSGALPGYQKISMGVLLVTGGGADWEYSWQPATGPRLHTHRYLMPAGDTRAYELSWTTRDQDWTAHLRNQRTLLETFRDPSRTTPTWAVPSPQ